MNASFAATVDHRELPASGVRQHARSEHTRNSIARLPRAQRNLHELGFAPRTASPPASTRPFELEGVLLGI